MRKRLVGGWGLAAAILAGSPAFAQYASPPSGMPTEGHAPGEPGRGPGPITRAEAQAAVERGFALIDSDHDGVVTGQEFAAFRDARRAAMMERHGSSGDDGDRDRVARRGGMRGMGGAGMFLRGDWFAHADANGDGRVTLAEAQSAAMALFDRVDLNRDGIVSPDERRAAMDDMRGRRGTDGGDMPPR